MQKVVRIVPEPKQLLCICLQRKKSIINNIAFSQNFPKILSKSARFIKLYVTFRFCNKNKFQQKIVSRQLQPFIFSQSHWFSFLRSYVPRFFIVLLLLVHQKTFYRMYFLDINIVLLPTRW